MDNGAGKQSHVEVAIKTEVEEAAPSNAYIDIEVDLNYIKTEPDLVDIIKSEPGLSVKEGRQNTDEPRCVQVASTSANVCSMSIVARNPYLSSMLNIKTEPEDAHVDHAVVTDTHYGTYQAQARSFEKRLKRPCLDHSNVPVYQRLTRRCLAEHHYAVEEHRNGTLASRVVKQETLINHDTMQIKPRKKRDRKNIIGDARKASLPSYICDYCGKIYGSRATLLIHIKKLHGSLSHRCADCQIDFLSKRYLESHIEKLHPKEEPECEFCKKVFKNKQRLNRHFQSVHGKKATASSPAYICDYCGKIYRRRATLLIHIKKLHGSLPHRCTECQTDFLNKQYLESHIEKLHPKEEPECEFCKKLFKNKQRLNRHLQEVHSKKAADALRSQLYRCDKCLTATKTHASLKLHYRRVHGKETHKCTECNKEFKCKDYLLNHISYAHSAEKFECGVCRASCKSKQALFNHLSRLHRPDFQRPIYVCDYCRRTFKARSAIQTHIASVHESTAAKCNRCDKNFKCQQYLAVHAARCKATLREMCNICGKYVRPRYLKQHTRYMHDEKNFQCKVCGTVLRSKLYLRLHVNNLHGQQSAAVDNQRPHEATSTIVGSAGEAAGSAEQRGLSVKEESADTDLDIGPIVLQHMDSHYRTNENCDLPTVPGNVEPVKMECSITSEEQIVKNEPDLSTKEDITGVDPH